MKFEEAYASWCTPKALPNHEKIFNPLQFLLIEVIRFSKISVLNLGPYNKSRMTYPIFYWGIIFLINELVTLN